MRYKRIRKLSRPTHLIVEHMSMCFTNHNTITRHQSYCSRFVPHLLFKLVSGDCPGYPPQSVCFVLGTGAQILFLTKVNSQY